MVIFYPPSIDLIVSLYFIGTRTNKFVVMAFGSGSASVSRSVGVAASSATHAPSIEGGAAPTEGLLSIGSGTHGQCTNTNVAVIEVENALEDGEPGARRQKKSTSLVWDHYTRTAKTVVEDGKYAVQRWAQCNHCKYNNRCEVGNGKMCFWNHVKKKT